VKPFQNLPEKGNGCKRGIDKGDAELALGAAFVLVSTSLSLVGITLMSCPSDFSIPRILFCQPLLLDDGREPSEVACRNTFRVFSITARWFILPQIVARKAQPPAAPASGKLALTQ
jgi:hypothetical protein